MSYHNVKGGSGQSNNYHPPYRAIERIGKYIDGFLHPLVTQTPSYLKVSTEVIHLLKGLEWKKSYILATANGTSPYTIISHQHGSEALDTFLRRDVSMLPIQRVCVAAAQFYNVPQLFFVWWLLLSSK